VDDRVTSAPLLFSNRLGMQRSCIGGLALHLASLNLSFLFCKIEVKIFTIVVAVGLGTVLGSSLPRQAQGLGGPPLTSHLPQPPKWGSRKMCPPGQGRWQPVCWQQEP
jgi:hypothetical protein